MTNQEIRDRVIHTLGLQTDTSFSESGYVDQLIFEGINDILARTHAAMRVIVMTVQPNTEIHDLSQQVIQVLDIERDGDFLERYSREEIMRRQHRRQPGYCWEEPLLWLSPISAEVTTIRTFGVFRPQKMTAPDQTPSLPQFGGLQPEYHPTIITYCLWKAGEYMQHEGSGEGEKWRIQYEGQDGNRGEISKIKRIARKRVTPRAAIRRNAGRGITVTSARRDWIHS